jgi:hypothetical protein
MRTGQLTRMSVTVAQALRVSSVQTPFGGSPESRTPLQSQVAMQNTWRSSKAPKTLYGFAICCVSSEFAKADTDHNVPRQQGSIAWANERNLRNVNNIDLRYHFTNMLITAGQVNVKCIESANNLADVFTKSLVGAALPRGQN